MTTISDYYYDLSVPILHLGGRKGWTEYIDFITLEEVTSPVMKGTDCFGRHFIVIKMLVDDITILQTFFQRYSSGTRWMGCGHATVNLIDTCGGITEYQVQLLRDIIDDLEPEMKEEHKPCQSKWIGQKVKLCS